jgi:hypothetical protein
MGTWQATAGWLPGLCIARSAHDKSKQSQCVNNQLPLDKSDGGATLQAEHWHATYRCLFLLMDSKLRFFQRLSRIRA